MRKLAAALLALFIALPAFAGHPAYRPVRGATVVVHVDPWSPTWRPAPRAGYVWVDGYWDYDVWVPGYWETVKRRVHVPGYWEKVWHGPEYGYRYDRCGRRYRYVVRPGHYDRVWVPGRYEVRYERVWRPGYWRRR